MATKKEKKKTEEEQKLNRQVVINAQYIKDLSFENPTAPHGLITKSDAPKIDVSVDIQVLHIQEKAYEVTLTIHAKANRDKNALFIVELSYSGIFTVDVPENEKEPVLMIYCPGMLFPFARRVIADATRDGGFLPLMLDPIDFAALFQQHKVQQKKEKSD